LSFPLIFWIGRLLDQALQQRPQLASLPRPKCQTVRASQHNECDVAARESWSPVPHSGAALHVSDASAMGWVLGSGSVLERNKNTFLRLRQAELRS
jgi:hypothetical protein